MHANFMNAYFVVFLLALSLNPILAGADDSDANFGSIKKIDLSDDKPASPNHTLIMLNLKKVKPGMLGQIILYQFAKRMRLEFEADGLPKGDYVLAVAPKCTAGDLGKAWTELHRFKSTSAHLQTEKSLTTTSLHESKPNTITLAGKSLALFKIKPPLMVDCKLIE